MNATIQNLSPKWRGVLYFLLSVAVFFGTPRLVLGQLDQGAITGTVTDSQGAVVPRASVHLTNIDTNFTIEAQTDGSGVYTFQPVKIGHYSVAVGATGFSTTTKSGLELQVGQRLEADIRLNVGAQTESVKVSAVDTPLLQTDDASTGQVMTQKQITDIPLNQRNYVFLAQLSAGVNASNGSRGQGNGDFNANGQRATQNNYILDGVDNNSNAIDFLNGASYVVKPPPDALQEFKIQTSDSSAEFGHSAGGVINATIKPGTNTFHGDVWEYFRNNDLGAPPGQWYAPNTPHALPYHQNQFGGTIGGPIVKNKLFFFFDYEGNRIIQDAPQLTTVPTALMKSAPGNLTQLLDTTLTGQTQPIKLYEPGSGGTATLGSKCGNAANIMCSSEIDPIALKLFQMYPAANTGVVGQTYNNYAWSQATADTTNQMDARVDYNLSTRDQIFGRVSWAHENKTETAPLGPVLDGGGTFSDGTFTNYAKNAVLSWNHVFSQTLTNQARFAYNWGYFNWLAQSANVNLAAQFGFGGVPFQPSNGGLPNIGIGGNNGINGIGTPAFTPSPEHQDVYQIIDDATKIWGNHSFKLGVNFQNIRYSVIQPTNAHTSPGFDGHITGQPGTSFTGSGIADYLADQQNSNNTSSFTSVNNGHWYRAAYVQDDWKVNERLSLNLGVRYDFFQPPIERNDHQAAFYPTGGIDVPGGGTGVYVMPRSQQNIALSPIFLNLLLKDNITLKYTANRELVNPQHTNFAPRIGISYRASDKMVVRTGFGIFFNGVENLGNFPNQGTNYPYDIEGSYPAPNCSANNCPSNGITFEGGPPTTGLNVPSLAGTDPNIKTNYTLQQNLFVQFAISSNTTASLGYVGSESRHLAIAVTYNGSAALLPPGLSTQPFQPFPDFGGTRNVAFAAIANYNSLQAKLERRYSNGLSFLSSYTWSHNLDDSREPLPSNGDGSFYRSYNVLGARPDYGNSPFDTQQRFVFTGTYELPFGQGHKYMDKGGVMNILAGGWNATILFRTQTGNGITINPNTSTANGASAHAIRIGDPFSGGGTAPANNPITCPARVRTRANWYNPCAFENPPEANAITAPLTGAGNFLKYLGDSREQMHGPGYERIDTTLTKNFKTYESQYLQFRADVFNLFNTPTWGAPSNTGISAQGGQITGTNFLGNFTPDARFFQLALKYYF
jgi:hypothetical protein